MVLVSANLKKAWDDKIKKNEEEAKKKSEIGEKKEEPNKNAGWGAKPEFI